MPSATPTSTPDERVAAVRRFNRYYTNVLGLLQEGLLETPYSLTDARVIFELAAADEPVDTSGLRCRLDIDPGYQLRDPSGSPKVRAFFEQLKKQLIPNYDPNAGAELEHAAPTAATARRPLAIAARAPRGQVFGIVLPTHHHGATALKLTATSPAGDAR